MTYFILDIVLLKKKILICMKLTKQRKSCWHFFFNTCFKVSPFTIPIDSGGLSLGLQTDKFHFQIHTQ